MRQKDIPAWEELQASVKRICQANSLAEMRALTEQEYLAAKASGKGKHATIQAFINFSLRGYLTDPENPSTPLPHAAPYAGELATVKYRLKQIGEL